MGRRMPTQAARPAGDGQRPRFRPRFIPKRKVCQFCVEKVKVIDYKTDIPLLRRYLSDRLRIEPKRRTGVCASHQRVLATAIKRARVLALLPFTSDHSLI